MTETAPAKHGPDVVLLATDLSARCDRALDRAAELARGWRARLVAVHALEGDAAHFADRGSEPSWRAVADPALIAEQRLRHDLQDADGPVSMVVERQDPVDLILEVAGAKEAGLIVTGLARNEPLGRFWLGTTVDSLLERSTVPVLVVKERPRTPYRRVLVAVDFSETSRRALLMAAELFPRSALTVLHAFDPPLAGLVGEAARYREEWRAIACADCAAFIAAADLPVGQAGRIEIVTEYGELASLLSQYARDRQIDLVVVGKSDPGPLLSLILGSTSERILASLDGDVMVVPDRAA